MRTPQSADVEEVTAVLSRLCARPGDGLVAAGRRRPDCAGGRAGPGQAARRGQGPPAARPGRAPAVEGQPYPSAPPRRLLVSDPTLVLPAWLIDDRLLVGEALDGEPLPEAVVAFLGDARGALVESPGEEAAAGHLRAMSQVAQTESAAAPARSDGPSSPASAARRRVAAGASAPARRWRLGALPAPVQAALADASRAVGVEVRARPNCHKGSTPSSTAGTAARQSARRSRPIPSARAPPRRRARPTAAASPRWAGPAAQGSSLAAAKTRPCGPGKWGRLGHPRDSTPQRTDRPRTSRPVPETNRSRLRPNG